MDHNHQNTDGRGDRLTRRSPFRTQRGDEAAWETNGLGMTTTDVTDVETDNGLRLAEAAGGSGDTAPNNSSGVCPECGAVFSGFPGMRLHMRGAHPELFHATAVANLQESRNRLWMEEETRMMVRFELEHQGERQINIFIQKNLFSQRTTNQISCHRKGAKYREAVATARAEGNGNGGGCRGLGSPRTAVAATGPGDFGSPPPPPGRLPCGKGLQPNLVEGTEVEILNGPWRSRNNGQLRTRVVPDKNQPEDSTIWNPWRSDLTCCQGTPADSRIQTSP